MKTKEEIIKNSLKVNENYQVNSIIDQITEGLNSRVQQGYKSFEYVFRTGNYETAKEMSKHVAARLNAMGVLRSVRLEGNDAQRKRKTDSSCHA